MGRRTLVDEVLETGKFVGEKFSHHFLGKKYLREIVPDIPTQIKSDRMIKHPLVMIVKENGDLSDLTNPFKVFFCIFRLLSSLSTTVSKD